MRRVALAYSLVIAALAPAPGAPQVTPSPGQGIVTQTLTVPVFPGQTLKPTLTLPALDQAPYPAVLLIAVREPGAAGPAAAQSVADALLARGIAVIRLDVPPRASAADATGDPVEQPADDAFAVLQFAREREDVDGDRVGIVGVGEAAGYAARAAALDEAARAVVLLDATPVDSDTVGLPAALPLLSLPLAVRAAPAAGAASSPVTDAAAFLARHLQ